MQILWSLVKGGWLLGKKKRKGETRKLHEERSNVIKTGLKLQKNMFTVEKKYINGLGEGAVGKIEMHNIYLC